MIKTTDNSGKTIFTNDRGDIAYIADQHVENYVMSQERGISNERMKIVACPFISGDVLYSESYTDQRFQSITVVPIMDFVGTGNFVDDYPQYRFQQYINAMELIMNPPVVEPIV